MSDELVKLQPMGANWTRTDLGTELAPLPETTFEGWTVRYGTDTIDGVVIMLNAEVWEPNSPTTGEPTFRLYVKWDGCSHLSIPAHLHFDTDEQFQSFSRLVLWIRNDLCDQVGMAD